MPAFCTWIWPTPEQQEKQRREYHTVMRKLFRSPQRRDRRLLSIIRREERDRKRAKP